MNSTTAASSSSLGPSSTTSGPSRERVLPFSSANPIALTTLRKSSRRVLSLSSGLRVRMRTLFLPQLLPVRKAHESLSDREHDEAEGERRIVLCVEIEHPSESLPIDGFEVQAVNVEVGGKGGQAIAELICQPETETGVFPLKLRPVEQYNLLYVVNISSTPETADRGDEQRPVSITAVGRPYTGETFPTSTFHSRWNCTLDLKSFYPSADISATPIVTGQAQNPSFRPVTHQAPAIAGDKRYCLATSQPERSDSRRIVSRPHVPNGLTTRAPSLRVPSQPSSDSAAGLLLSVKLLPSSSRPGSTVRALEPFSIEVFVHNRTNQVKRFRLSIPGREGSAGGIMREIWEKRRRKGNDEPGWGVDGASERNHVTLSVVQR